MKIGTRKSPLALAQAEEVRALLAVAWPELEVEVVPMMTSGDRFLGRPLAEIGGKGLFTKEIEEALLDGRIDIAVHSLKDMPTILPDGLTIGCMLPREDPRDRLLGDGIGAIADLPQGAAFGTSSLRRAAQLLAIRPDIAIVPLRGNVQTRLAKIAAGGMRATMLAQAGLNRLGLRDVPGVTLTVEEFLPAVAQGVIGIECRADDGKAAQWLAPLGDLPTERAAVCERAFLRALDGSCRTPIAGYAAFEDGGLRFRGMMVRPDGTHVRRVEMVGDASEAERLGKEAGRELLRMV